MTANHSDCRYAIPGNRVPVAGTRYTTIFIRQERRRITDVYELKRTLKQENKTVQKELGLSRVSYGF